MYKAGTPLLIYDAERLLRILREEDYVRLASDSLHNYMSYLKEGIVYKLPWKNECSEGHDSVLTKKRYNGVVRIVEWQLEDSVMVIA